MNRTMNILLLVVILLSACGNNSDDSLPDLSGRYRGLLDSGYQPVVEIGQGGLVTVFSQDMDDHTVNPQGTIFSGEWSLLTNPQKDTYFATLIKNDSDDWWLNNSKKISDIWKYEGNEENSKNKIRLFFVHHEEKGWGILDAEKQHSFAMTWLTKEKEYPMVREEDCPRPAGQYQVTQKGTGPVREIARLEIQENGSVVLHFADDSDQTGILLKGHWTLWKNLEQEGTYPLYRLESWKDWNEETKYVWRFDSDDSYSFSDSDNVRVWLLFTFKEIGNVWLHYNGVSSDTPYLLSPAQ